MRFLFFGDRLLNSVIPLAKISYEFMLKKTVFDCLCQILVHGKLNCELVTSSFLPVCLYI